MSVNTSLVRTTTHVYPMQEVRVWRAFYDGCTVTLAPTPINNCHMLSASLGQSAPRVRIIISLDLLI